MRLIGFHQATDPGYPASRAAPHRAPGRARAPTRSARWSPTCGSGHPVPDATELTVDVVGGAFRVPGGSSLLTDGHFVWREDLAPYVERYRIELPPDCVQTAHRNGFRIPGTGRETMLTLSVDVGRTPGFRPRP